jgi:antiphage defense system Thoeris ThsB-like protein
MAANVFVSYDHDDQKQVSGFKLLKANPDHPLDFQDHSLKDAVRDRTGKPIKYPPSDPRSKPVRDEIKKKLDRSSKLVVLIGDDTHKSEWVDWEVKTFWETKKPLSGGKTWKRIRGMTLKGSEQAKIPAALGDRSTKVLAWDPNALDKWLDEDPDK